MSVGHQLGDGRSFPVAWISYELDDLALSPEAFRVYLHILRRVGKNDKAWPSYRTIGTHCFPSMKEESARSKAMRAVKELLDWNLIRVEKIQSNAGFHANRYYLTNDSEWRNPSDVISPPSDVISPPSDVISPPSDVISPPSDVISPQYKDLQCKDFSSIDSQGKKDPPTPQGGTGFLSQEGGSEKSRGREEEDPNPKPPEPPKVGQDTPEQPKSCSEDQTSPAPTPIYSVHKKEHQDRIVQIYQANKPIAWQPVNNLHRAIKVQVDSLLSSEDFQGDLEAFLTRLENALLELNDPTTRFGWFRNQGNLGITTLLSNYGKHLMEFSNAWTERQNPQVRSDVLPDWALEAQKEIEARQTKKAG